MSEGVSTHERKPISSIALNTDGSLLTISSDGVPLLDIEIRYKGSYTANPQFQAMATANFKQLFKKKK